MSRCLPPLTSRHSPFPWTAREYGYEKIALLDANGAEIGFVHRRGDAKAIIAASLESSQSELVEALREADELLTALLRSYEQRGPETVRERARKWIGKYRPFWDRAE
jgi:hypothetical protein